MVASSTILRASLYFLTLLLSVPTIDSSTKPSLSSQIQRSGSLDLWRTYKDSSTASTALSPLAMRNLDHTDYDSEEDVFLQDASCPTIAEHASQCDSLFHRYMAVPEIVPDPTIIDDQLARFTLWASNMDVYGPLNISLDYRLRYSPTIVEIIHQLLDVISDSLTSRKYLSHQIRMD